MAQAEFRKTINQAKAESWKHFVSNLNFRDPFGKVYTFIRKMNRRELYHHPQGPTTYQGQVIADNKTKAEAGASHLHQTIGKKDPFEGTSPHSTTFTKARKLSMQQSVSNYNKPFSKAEFELVLKTLPETSSDSDNIYPVFFKRLTDKWKDILLQLINKLWKEGNFPTIWKNGTSIMIPKPNKPYKVENHRFITLLPVGGKIYERLVKERLRFAIDEANLLQDIQTGFCRERNTVDNLIRMQRDIIDALDNGKVMIAVFLDVKGAFDNLVHRQILQGLSKAKINGNLMKFTLSYLSDRKIAVTVGQERSKEIEVERGVPQGSVLGPDYYNVGEFDIPLEDNNCKGGIFADDNNTWTIQNTVEEAEKVVQETLDQIELWSLGIDLDFEPSKAKVMLFTSKRNIRPPLLTLFGEELLVTNCHKVLGIHIDDKLQFSQHVKYLKESCAKRLNLMKMLSCGKHGVNIVTARQFYIKYIRPKIDYGSLIYSIAPESTLRKLDTIQNTALRLAFGAHQSTPIPFLLGESGVEKLNTRREKMLIVYMNHLWKADFNHPVKKLIIKPGLTHTRNLHRKRKRLNPFEKFEELLTQEGIEVPITQMLRYEKPPKIPPWDWVQIECQIDYMEKMENNPLIMRYEFLSVLNSKYQEYVKIYTDGSKINGLGVGCSAVVPEFNTVITKSLSKESTVFEAEIKAIESALEWVLRKTSESDENQSKFLICSDSKSALQSLKNFPNKQNDEVHKCYSSILKIVGKGIVIQFLWCPAHVGVAGNEKADKYAKLTAQNMTLTPPTETYKQIREMVRKIYQKHFEEMRDNSSNIALTQKKKPGFDMKNYSRLKRKYGCLMFRFRSTHVGIKHRLFIIGKTDSPQCDNCSEIESIFHYVVECKEYENLRKEMMNLCKEENLGEFSVALALGILIDDDSLKYRKTDLFIKFIQESCREKDFI